MRLSEELLFDVLLRRICCECRRTVGKQFSLKELIVFFFLLFFSVDVEDDVIHAGHTVARQRPLLLFG